MNNWTKFRGNLNWSRRELIVIALVVIPLGLFYTLFLAPRGIRVLCPFYELTGLYDAFEGMTSSLYHLLHGNLYSALRLNPLIYILPPFLLVWFYFHMSKQKKLDRMCFLIFITILLGFTILRNIEPFYFLRPMLP